MPLHGVSLFLASLKLLKKIYHEFPFELIDGHYIYPDGLAAVLLGKAMKKPVVLSARGSDINQFGGFKSIKPMIRYSLNHSDRAISVCDALKREMVDLGSPANKISVIPNGIDIKGFYPEDKKKARRKLSLPDDKNIILSVGSLIPRKGFHVILDAMPEILQNQEDVHLYIVGDGSYRSFLNDKIRRLNLRKQVTMVGERPNSELKTWYSAADIFCLASSREGWANVIMESLACGTPVVATNVWGAPEILTSHDVGILVERNSGSIADGLIEALKRKWDRMRIRDHVAARSWDVVASEVEAVFASCLQAKNDGNMDTDHLNSQPQAYQING